MKKLIYLLFYCSFSAVAQSITAPEPLTIEANASGVDAGNFVITWTNNTDAILVSVSLEYQNGNCHVKKKQ
jgi:hypothetical protein